jgi:superfamily II DNA helicase RecQ
LFDLLEPRDVRTLSIRKDDIKRILQDKQFHLQLKSEQKEIIQNVLERKDSMAVLPTGFGKNMRYVLPLSFWTR